MCIRDRYGADALRFMLVDGSTPGNDMRYIEKKVEAARNFANKLWNATRFVLMNLPEDFEPGLPSEDKLDMSEKWVLTKLNQVAGAMTDNLDQYEMGLAAAKIKSCLLYTSATLPAHLSCSKATAHRTAVPDSQQVSGSLNGKNSAHSFSLHL